MIVFLLDHNVIEVTRNLETALLTVGTIAYAEAPLHARLPCPRVDCVVGTHVTAASAGGGRCRRRGRLRQTVHAICSLGMKPNGGMGLLLGDTHHAGVLAMGGQRGALKFGGKAGCAQVVLDVALGMMVLIDIHGRAATVAFGDGRRDAVVNSGRPCVVLLHGPGDGTILVAAVDVAHVDNAALGGHCRTWARPAARVANLSGEAGQDRRRHPAGRRVGDGVEASRFERVAVPTRFGAVQRWNDDIHPHIHVPIYLVGATRAEGRGRHPCSCSISVVGLAASQGMWHRMLLARR